MRIKPFYPLRLWRAIVKREYRHVIYKETTFNRGLPVDIWAENDRLVISCGDFQVDLTKREAFEFFKDGLDLALKIKKDVP